MWYASSSIVNTGEGANYQNMPLQCIVFSGLACSQHAIKLILVSDEADLRVDSNDSSPMCISCKTKKLFKLLLGSSQHEQSITQWGLGGIVDRAVGGITDGTNDLFFSFI